MTPFNRLTPVAVVAVLALGVAQAGADPRDGRGHGRRGRPVAVGHAQARPYPVYGPGRAVVRVSPRVVVPPAHFYRPYYSFRPRVSVGFGVWLGYPVAYPYYSGYYGYPYAHPYPYPYAYRYRYPNPYVYGYPGPGYGYPAPYPRSAYPVYPTPPPATGSVGVQPQDQQAWGGVSFEITPSTAAVFVDGTYVGTVSEFGPSSQPLGLTPGHHRIEIRAAGHQTLAFDVDVVPGQIVPYRGTLRESRTY